MSELMGMVGAIASMSQDDRCWKDLGLVPAGLKIKSPLNTKEAICIVKETCRRLIRAHINDCHRRINYANDKLLLCLSKLKELIPTPLLDTLTTIADKRADKTTEQHHGIVQSKLTRLQHAAHKKRHKTDKNWVRNIFFPSLGHKRNASTLLRT